MHILHVVGTRPNFMKVAPMLSALAARGARQTLVHTGQHYDVNMSDAIFRELRLPEPDVNLGVGSGSSSEQTAHVLLGIERCLAERRPDLMLVYGDTNSTMAAALAGANGGVRIGHVEAGLRSGDRQAPDEINRVVTDALSTWHFTPSADADDNLRSEGVPSSSIACVGNVLIDTLVRLLPLTQPQPLLQMFGLMNGSTPRPYALVTLHRHANVDDEDMLGRILDALADVAAHLPVIFPVHPRTRGRMKDRQLQFSGLLLTQPLTYLQFLGLQQHATVIITDSGGIQEEATYLGVPCLTVRDKTDRPVTVRVGTNHVVGRNVGSLPSHVCNVLEGRGKRGGVPPLWDGRAAERIADHLLGMPAPPPERAAAGH
jgi:UDP-N-acetylglucosamine 2-epimerase (non-hydrolysing)